MPDEKFKEVVTEKMQREALLRGVDRELGNINERITKLTKDMTAESFKKDAPIESLLKIKSAIVEFGTKLADIESAVLGSKSK